MPDAICLVATSLRSLFDRSAPEWANLVESDTGATALPIWKSSRRSGGGASRSIRLKLIARTADVPRPGGVRAARVR
jgi:hypothetical protein